LIHGLPVTFFVALAFLTVAAAILWMSSQDHGKLLCLQLLLLIAALWLIPLLTGGSHPNTDEQYRNFGFTEYIIRNGSLAPVSVWYHNWPAAWLLFAAGFEILGLSNLEAIFPIFPLLILLLCLPPLYVFLRNTLGEGRTNYCWAGCWLFYLASWIGQDIFNAQSIGYFLFLVLLALVSKTSIWKREPKTFAVWSVLTVVFAALAICHLLTVIVTMCLLMLLGLVKRSRNMALVTTFLAILLVTSLLTVSRPFTNQYLADFGAEAEIVTPQTPQEPGQPSGTMLTFGPVDVVESEINLRVSGSESHIAVAKSRILFSAIFVIIGLVGFALSRKARDALGNDIAALAIVAAALFLFVPMIAYVYQGGLLPRVYWFALPPMAYFGAKWFKNRIATLVLCFLLLVGFPLHVIAHYGNAGLDYFPQGQVSAAYFFHDKTTGGIVAVAPLSGRVKNIEHYRSLFYNVFLVGGEVVVPEPGRGQVPWYISINQQQRAKFQLLDGSTQLIDQVEEQLDNSTSYNLFYNNPDVKLYVGESGE